MCILILCPFFIKAQNPFELQNRTAFYRFGIRMVKIDKVTITGNKLNIDCDTVKIKGAIVLTDKLLIDFLNNWKQNNTDSIFCWGTSIEICNNKEIRRYEKKHFIGIDEKEKEPTFLDFIKWLQSNQ